MTSLTARNVALTDQLLATLADEGGLPISTMDLYRKLRGDLAGPATPAFYGYTDILRVLNRLAKQGEVEKITLPDMRCRYWRRWPQEAPR